MDSLVQCPTLWHARGFPHHECLAFQLPHKRKRAAVSPAFSKMGAHCALDQIFINWLQCRMTDARTYHEGSTSFAVCVRIDGKVSGKSRQFEHTVVDWRSCFCIPEGDLEGVIAIWIWQHSWN
ncbi:uncharacterized protein LOC133849748 [Drosophila sulfurigaster albostrigata]|uniref:uncharacterized protein LOC133849748 n=1 Tax=Drosophila sulfurigaster albostrigata TaxID=89887 RepID=UPI002D2188EF|nr:uncharacterized protein LOC133849748 [Drosophila sulfurigaster albostrigata]